jgi:hypothetical protein
LLWSRNRHHFYDDYGETFFTAESLFLFYKRSTNLCRVQQSKTNYIKHCSGQCCESGSVCIWDSLIWIQIHHYFVLIWIQMLQTSKISKKNLDFYYIVTSFWHFIYENWWKCKCTTKNFSVIDEKSRIPSWSQICKSVVGIRGSRSGSKTKCHRSTPLVQNPWP